jgi:serine protease Do
MPLFQLNSMNRLLGLLICAAILFSCMQSGILAQQNRNDSGARQGRLSAREIARRVLPAVSLIECDDGEDVSQGSGFFVGPGLVITNFHVIKGMRRGSLLTVSGAKRRFPISHVLQIDQTSDLALLGIDEAFSIRMASLQLNTSSVSVGESIYAFGNPEGLIGTMSPGIVSD